MIPCVAATAILSDLEASGLRTAVVQQHELQRVVIHAARLPEAARAGDMAWVRDARELDWCGGLLLVRRDMPPSLSIPTSHPTAVVAVDDPRVAMLRVLQRWCSEWRRSVMIDRHPSARVHATAVIGEPGAGYVWTGDRYESMPHVAGVVIDRDVEIGPHATVMRGVLNDTVIGAGSKIGQGVNIGHGVVVGEHCLVVAHASIGGSARIGNRVTIWQGALIANGVTVGDGAVIGMGAVVRRDIKPGEVWVGNPARRIDEDARGH